MACRLGVGSFCMSTARRMAGVEVKKKKSFSKSETGTKTLKEEETGQLGPTNFCAECRPLILFNHLRFRPLSLLFRLRPSR